MSKNTHDFNKKWIDKQQALQQDYTSYGQGRFLIWGVFSIIVIILIVLQFIH